MKKTFILMAVVTLLQACSTQDAVKVVVRNSTDLVRMNEMVELDYVDVLTRLNISLSDTVETDFVPSPEQSGSSDITGGATGSVDVPATDVQSPQTGVSETGVAAAAVSTVIFAAGAVVLGKKLKENVA